MVQQNQKVEKLNRAVSELHRTRWDEFRQRRAEAISNYIDLKQKQRIVRIIIGHIRFTKYLQAMLKNLKMVNKQRQRQFTIMFSVIRIFLQAKRLFLKYHREGGVVGLQSKLTNQIRHALTLYAVSNSQAVRCASMQAQHRRLNFTNLFPRRAYMLDGMPIGAVHKMSLVERLGAHLRGHTLNREYRKSQVSASESPSRVFETSARSPYLVLSAALDVASANELANQFLSKLKIFSQQLSLISHRFKSTFANE